MIREKRRVVREIDSRYGGVRRQRKKERERGREREIPPQTFLRLNGVMVVKGVAKPLGEPSSIAIPTPVELAIQSPRSIHQGLGEMPSAEKSFKKLQNEPLNG